ncbi:MAG TPA: right-handed parallel beta-helix repeat-containing protein, partial [Vicinamibacteria bacterium]
MRTLLLPALLLAAPAGFSEQMAPVAPGRLEGRPPSADLSPLQRRIDAAEPGATLEVAAGDYVGDLVVDKPLHLVGKGRPRLVGSGHGSVVRVRAENVTLEGFAIDGRRGGDMALDSAGVHTSARASTLRDLDIREALFGIYLREASGATVEGCRVRGIPGRDPGEKGSGIHAYNLEGFRFDDNEVVDVRDGLYLQNASRGLLRRNTARDVRYGLHYMFSDDNVFEDNTFENGAAGTAIMYSKRIVFRRNRFLRNRGFASVGLLFQTCEDVLAEDNLVADNARGVFIEGSQRITLRGNAIAGSDVAVVLYDPSGGHRFEGNAF